VDVNKVTEQLLSAPTLQEALSQLKMLHHQAAEQLPASSCQDAQCTSVPDLLTGLYLLFIYLFIIGTFVCLFV
jgi:hypothetical protein